MSRGLLEILPVHQRLALAYAPFSSRDALLALMAFDTRLAQSVRQANEPIMAQMRLAWWRDQLRLEEDKRERSDDVIVAIDRLAGMRRALFGMVDGWELLLGENFTNAAIGEIIKSRGRALSALSALLGTVDDARDVELAGQRWACAEIIQGLSDPEERKQLFKMAEDLGSKRVRLSRALRPLVVLDGLSRSSLAKPLLSGTLSGLKAIRLGLLGR